MKEENDGYTELHIAALKNNLGTLPKHLFTKEALALKTKWGTTVWHIAAGYGTLKDIPKHLFTKEALNQENDRGRTVWEVAIESSTLKDVPAHLITNEVLSQKNKISMTLWQIIGALKKLALVPQHLITSNLLNMKCFSGTTNKNYINNVLELPSKLNNFIEQNPELELSIIHRDSRLILRNVKENKLVFEFVGIKDSVILNKNGVLMNDKAHKNLHEAVLFIEENYPDIEQSMILPAKSIELKSFVL